MSPRPSNTVVLLTPPGVAAIAVIRFRGALVPDFLQRHLSKPAKLNRCVHANLLDDDRVIDDAVVVLCDPTTVDLNVHGGSWVVKSVLDLARREGFQAIQTTDLPLAAEATEGATLLDQEVAAHVPLARTELGLRTLLAQPALWKTLTALAATDPDSVQPGLSRILADQTLIHLLNPPTVAIIGLPNVGKSTLANRLFAQERSITADVPGTTRDWVGEIANIDGLPVLLLDTPGLRHTHDPIEATAIIHSREEIARAALTVLVLDATHPFQGDQSALVAAFPGSLVIVNKSDRPVSPDLTTHSAIHTVATTGQGVDQLRAAIVSRFCGSFPIRSDLAMIWTLRQRQIVQHAIDHSGNLSKLLGTRD